MARLGVRTLDEMVGRTDLLAQKTGAKSPMAGKLDLSAVLDNPYVGAQKVTFDPADAYDFELEKTMDEKILLKKLGEALAKGKKASVSVKVGNTDRTFGTLLGAEITRQHKKGLPQDTLTVNCKGAGGQSFGAFIPRGLTLCLEGDANDAGNVALYGATSGKAFFCGMAGERFAVRNSGALAVVEGVGEHGCEYMTGGRVVVLGSTGKNFAAGMSGGIAYVLDEGNTLYRNLNKEMISIEKMESRIDIHELKSLIEEHVERTGSRKGQEVLDHFEEYLPKFKKIIPYDYRRMTNLEAFAEVFQKKQEGND